MEEWVKKLLSGLGGGQGTLAQASGGMLTAPRIAPNIVPQGNDGVLASPRIAPNIIPQENGMMPVNQPYGAVPQSMPVTENAVDPFQDALGKARGDYQKAVTDPAHKQNPWLQALFQGLQGVQRIADPSNPANAKPVEWLGNAKKAARVNQAAGVLAPLEQQQERILGENYKRAQTGNIYEDNARQREEGARKRLVDKNRAENATALLADKRKGRELQATQIEDLREYRKFLIANGTKMTAARVKQIDERLDDYDLDREQKARQFGVTTGQKDRDFAQKQANFVTQMQAKIAADAQKGTLDKTRLKKDLSADLAAGKITQETFDALTANF